MQVPKLIFISDADRLKRDNKVLLSFFINLLLKFAQLLKFSSRSTYFLIILRLHTRNSFSLRNSTHHCRIWLLS